MDLLEFRLNSFFCREASQASSEGMKLVEEFNFYLYQIGNRLLDMHFEIK